MRKIKINSVLVKGNNSIKSYLPLISKYYRYNASCTYSFGIDGIQPIRTDG